MGIRNSSLSVSRRRRLLGEDSSAAKTTQAAVTRSAKSAQRKRYSSDALDSLDVRITDLIPVRRWTLSVIFLLGLTAVTSVLALFSQRAAWSAIIGAEATSAIDLQGRVHLGCWMSTLALLLSSVFATLIFAIRRHRADDYRGRYSIWLWASFAFLLASIDATAGVHRFVQGLISSLGGFAAGSQTGPWWLAAYFLVFGTLGIRLLIETRSARGTFSTLIMASVCYLLAGLLRAELIELDRGRLHALVETAALLLGHMLLMFSTIVYSRHVLLDAQGKLPGRKVKPKTHTTKSTKSSERSKKATSASKKTKLKSKNVETPRVAIHVAEDDQQQEMPSSRTSSIRSQQPTAPPNEPKHDASDEDNHDILPGPPENRLSKAERKRLRKEKRRQRRAA